jgi:hypothetical protein
LMRFGYRPIYPANASLDEIWLSPNLSSQCFS